MIWDFPGLYERVALFQSQLPSGISVAMGCRQLTSAESWSPSYRWGHWVPGSLSTRTAELLSWWPTDQSPRFPRSCFCVHSWTWYSVIPLGIYTLLWFEGTVSSMSLWIPQLVVLYGKIVGSSRGRAWLEDGSHWGICLTCFYKQIQNLSSFWKHLMLLVNCVLLNK